MNKRSINQGKVGLLGNEGVSSNPLGLEDNDRRM